MTIFIIISICLCPSVFTQHIKEGEEEKQITIH